MAMTQAWGSVCAGNNAQVGCVVPCAPKNRDTSCSSAALRASHGFPSLKALGARYSARVSTPCWPGAHCTRGLGLLEGVCMICLCVGSWTLLTNPHQEHNLWDQRKGPPIDLISSYKTP